MKLKGKLVLVVEDEPALCEAIRAKLQLEGATVLTAKSVEEAMAHLEKVKTVDAVWLDHYLFGKESGLDLVMKIKNGEDEWKKIPIYVVSNTASDDKVNTYIQLGIDKYFTKADYRLEQIIEEMVGKSEDEEEKKSENGQ
jgi:CheY-like chemotaxis protein